MSLAELNFVDLAFLDLKLQVGERQDNLHSGSFILMDIYKQWENDIKLRTNIDGYHVTDYLKQLLSLKYPHHMSKLTWEKVEDLKMEHCYITSDYASEVRVFQRGDKEVEEKTRCWQLPWTPSPVEEPPSEEEVARKVALKERQGQRLREMAEVKMYT